MIFIVAPALILGMLGYMFWHVAYAMRRDRVRGEREARKGRFRIRR